jgi:hypothetical protein
MPALPDPQQIQPSLSDWIEALRSIAAIAGADPSYIHRVGPIGFLRWMGVACTSGAGRAGIDESLWMATVDPLIDAGAVESLLEPEGPIHRQTGEQAIELWTERELGALHALWRLAILRDHAPWRRRALDAASWHLEHTQPDNATNHPWSIPVFLDLWRTDPDPEIGISARCYAETLLHNCQAQSARPDPLSALILRDAADGLEQAGFSG